MPIYLLATKLNTEFLNQCISKRAFFVLILAIYLHPS